MSLLSNLAKSLQQSANSENPIISNKLSEDNDVFLSSMIQLQDSIPVESRVFRDDYIPVANLIKEDFCPRQWHIARVFDKKEELYETVNGNMRIVWEMGRSVESHIRNQLISFMDKSTILGKWRCKCGAKEISGFYKNINNACNKCNSTTESYNEYTLIDVVNGVAGNPDFIYVNNEGKYVPVEIKSIKKGKDKSEKDSFLGLSQPKGDNLIQLACYRKLMIANGLDVTDYGRILYCSKDFVMETPYKEYKVDLRVFDNIINIAWAKAKTIYDIVYYARVGTYPKRLPQCTSPTDKLASSCKMCTLCFNLPNI